MYLRENLAYLRKKNSLSQVEVGQMLGVTKQAVSNWERGYTSGMAVETIISLAKLFSVSIDDLLTKDLSPTGSVFGRNLQYLRKSVNAKGKEIAKIFGVNHSTYSKYENGLVQPSMEGLVKISEFFGVTVDDLLKKDLSKEGEHSDR